MPYSVGRKLEVAVADAFTEAYRTVHTGPEEEVSTVQTGRGRAYLEDG